MGRSPCCSKEGLNRGAWTALEDKILTAYIKAHGEGKWRNLPKRAGLKRCGKSCRLRWLNYLRPDIKRGNISRDEEELIIRLHNLLGNRWSLIAGRLPGRTDNEIKNYWNTTLGKKAKAQTESSSPENSGPKKTATEPQTTKPSNSPPGTATKASQVIRTKAIRCTKVLYPLQPPSEVVETNNFLSPQNPPVPEDQWNRNELLHVISGYDADFLNFGSSGQIQTCIHGEEQYSLQPFVEEMLQDWTKNPCLEEDNASLDLDSLELFLNTEEWP
ncbi:hypothetical protein SLE2022_147940 [Rubroshorea leprosula]